MLDNADLFAVDESFFYRFTISCSTSGKASQITFFPFSTTMSS
jgi:hypothetical protein